MKMKNPFQKSKKQEKETQEKQEKEAQEKLEKEREEFDLDEIGLSEDSFNEPMIEVQRSGSSSGYIDQVPMSEIKDIYDGSIHEYLKNRFGAGDYLVSVRKRNKRSTTRRIKIAGDHVEPFPRSEIGAGHGESGGVDHNFLAMWTQVQSEKARLEAELEHLRNESRNEIFTQIGTVVSPLLQALVTRVAGNEDSDPAAVIRAAVEGIKSLVEVRDMVIPASGGKEGSELGQMIAGIGLALENINRMRQGNLPNDAPFPTAPTLPAWSPPQVSPQQAPLTGAGGFAGTPTSQRPAHTQPPPRQSPLESSKDLAEDRPQRAAPAGSGAAPTRPVEREPDLMSGVRGGPEPSTSFDDLFIDVVVGMAEQKQNPQLVADYIMKSLADMEKNVLFFEPQVQMIIRQAIQMPTIVWDYVCGTIPELASDAEYAKEIRDAIESASKKSVTKV